MKNDMPKIGFAAASNLLLAGGANALNKVGEILHLLLTIGQVGVATITIIYIWKKIRAIHKQKDTEE